MTKTLKVGDCIVVLRYNNLYPAIFTGYTPKKKPKFVLLNTIGMYESYSNFIVNIAKISCDDLNDMDYVRYTEKLKTLGI